MAEGELDVDVVVTMQEHAEEILDATPLHCETKVDRGAEAEEVV